MSAYHTITSSDGEEIFNIKNFDALHYWAQENGKFIEQAEDYKRISLTYKKLEELKEDIIKAIKDVHPEYNCFITIDRDYH